MLEGYVFYVFNNLGLFFYLFVLNYLVFEMCVVWVKQFNRKFRYVY